MHKDNTIMTLDLDSIKPEEIKTLSSKEYLDILIKLQNFHTVFYKMWELGNISFSKDLKTAGILFNTEGECVEFKFNPDFWDQLSEYQRLFIICHECLHVILNHGYRLVSTHPLNRPVANIAADIVDNHILLDSFDFNREELGGLSKELCFIDTIFGENYKELRIEENGSMEYYFNKLKDNAIKIECFSTIDEHGIMNGEGADKGDSEEGSDSEKDSGSSKNNIPDYSKLFEKLGNSLTNEEKQELKKAIKTHDEGTKPGSKLAGTGIGKWYSLAVPKVKPKQKWETVIKKWSRKYDKPDFKGIEQWTRINRRFTSIINGNMMLPTEMEQEFEVESKINVFFFQDTSGSCWNLKDRFFRAARSLPKDRFNVRLFCFDTEVKETDIDSGKIYGGGGTCFDIIEYKIQQLMKLEKIKYPEAVFVITDGYGSNVSPQEPKKWYWFLSENYTYHIPQLSQRYMLKDFE